MRSRSPRKGEHAPAVVEAGAQGRERHVGTLLATDLTEEECHLNVAAPAQAVAAPVAKTALHDGLLTRRPAQPGNQIGHSVDPGNGLPSGAPMSGAGFSAARARVSRSPNGCVHRNCGLPEEGNRVQAFAVDPLGLGFGVGEGRPGLTDRELPPLAVGVAKPEQVAGAGTGEIALDERAHRADPRRGAQVEVERLGAAE